MLAVLDQESTVRASETLPVDLDASQVLESAEGAASRELETTPSNCNLLQLLSEEKQSRPHSSIRIVVDTNAFRPFRVVSQIKAVMMRQIGPSPRKQRLCEGATL